jgi:16S rRNA (cytidine1402-2'-O)-methyltransferase
VPHGRLVVCATPIGNLGDISERLRNTLSSADVIYAEDTRRTSILLRHLVISTPVVSLFTGNEMVRTEQLVEAVRRGETVALVSDAGMPTVSDPGAAAVRAVRAAGLAVSVVPGPSAVTAAIALSGFGGDRFVFEGFLPRRGGERSGRLAELAGEQRPVVIFASPKRLPSDLSDLRDACGGARLVTLTRELTKLHEECWVGSLDDAVRRYPEEVKGEVTLVLGPREPEPPSLEAALKRARSLVGSGESVREVARQVADGSGVSRRDIYEALIKDQESS